MIVSKDQNTIEHEGKLFGRKDDGTCKECDPLKYNLCNQVPCMSYRRIDGKESIFVELNKTESDPSKWTNQTKNFYGRFLFLRFFQSCF
jgi:hypothetical protein